MLRDERNSGLFNVVVCGCFDWCCCCSGGIRGEGGCRGIRGVREGLGWACKWWIEGGVGGRGGQVKNGAILNVLFSPLLHIH